jgi:hypothetical protein
MFKTVLRYPVAVFYVFSLASYFVSKWVFLANDCLSPWKWGNFACELSDTHMRTVKTHLMSKTLGALATAMSFLSSGAAHLMTNPA